MSARHIIIQTVRECQTPPNTTRFETRKTFFTLKLKKEKGIHAHINQDGFTNVRLLLKKKKISTTHCVWRHPFLIFLFLIFSFFEKENDKKVIQVLNLCQPQLLENCCFRSRWRPSFFGNGRKCTRPLLLHTGARTRRQTSTKIRTMRGTS